MQERADEAVAELAGTHFDIPDAVRTIECMIAPDPAGGIYYTGPREDFTRPGRMWWSVPKGVTEFATWRELTTVYHEGVRATTCRSRRPSTAPSCSTAGAGWSPGSRATARAGRCTPSG